MEEAEEGEEAGGPRTRARAGAGARAGRAGSIRRISVENFMCHGNLTIELGGRVNFITGRNGSGKSAILTAICVAFGIKAKGTQRANAIRDFVKNGCRHALVVVELSNEGDDAYRPGTFGDTILVERRITDTTSTFTVKDGRGRKVGTKREDVLDVVEHFNIDVENPCVVMTQDKSREFLHTGSDKDKFRFFFKATLLQQVCELLGEWEEKLNGANAMIDELEKELEPNRSELRHIDEQLKTLEKVGALRTELENLEKVYAWSYVREAKMALSEAEAHLIELKSRIPICQRKIDAAQAKVDEKRAEWAECKQRTESKMQNAQELKSAMAKLQRALREATNDKIEAQEDMKRHRSRLQEASNRLSRSERDIAETQERMLRDTQAEVQEKVDELRVLEGRKSAADNDCMELRNEEMLLRSELQALEQQLAAQGSEVERFVGQMRDLKNLLRDLQNQQSNEVTAFGGPRVLRLLQTIEENQQRFTRPPVGPIGSHLGLLEGQWSLALEVAVGSLFDNFVVTNHKDFLLLRQLATQIGYSYLRIITYGFEIPPIRPGSNQLPDDRHLSILAAVRCNHSVVKNILIDQGTIEQKVFAEDYNAGKVIVFGHGSRNVKEVITMDGVRMFNRAGAETTLPKDRRLGRNGRVGVRVDDQIGEAQAQGRELESGLAGARKRKSEIDDHYRDAKRKCTNVERRRIEAERKVRLEESRIKDMQAVIASETQMNEEASRLEPDEELAQVREEMERHHNELQMSEARLDLLLGRWAEAKAALETFSEATRGESESTQRAEQDLLTLDADVHEAEEKVTRFRKVMDQKVLPDIQKQELVTQNMQRELETSRETACQICPEAEGRPSVDECRSRQQLGSQIRILQERVNKHDKETQAQDNLLKKGNTLRKRIASREKWFTNIREKLEMLQAILAERKKGYRRNCLLLRRELTWGFNGYLGKKGLSGSVTVDFEQQTLNMSVQMPHDASNTSVRDTRALSGGERSFSTLAFALAVHSMTEAPFRAMDEFDVFMDAVSRKISLQTVVEFALQEGSQWIFITPNEISSVKGTADVKKQQMPAPRP